MPGTTVFRIALTISLLLHGLFLFVWIQRNDSNTLNITTTDTLRVSLRVPPSPEFDEHSKPEEPVEEEKPSPAVEPNPQPQQSPVPDSGPDEKVQEDDSELVLQQVLQPIEVAESVLNQSVASMISAIVEQDRIRAFETSIAHLCTSEATRIPGANLCPCCR